MVSFILTLIVSLQCWSQSNHQLIRRIAVFPIKADKSLNQSTEDAWWRIRKRLTDDDRFLIASRNFMIQRDVYMPREELTPADAIILGKILDAHALITTYIQDGQMHMVAYDGRNSQVLWRQQLPFNKNRKRKGQVLPMAERLVNDFIANVPYQGFQIVDFRYDEVTFEEAGRLYARVKLPANLGVAPGDPVQWIELKGQLSSALFMSDQSGFQAIAGGKVESYVEDNAIVLIHGGHLPKVFREGALIRIPRIADQMREKFAINRNRNLSPDIYIAEMTKTKKDEDTQSLTTALTFIANLAAFIVLAF